MAAKPEPDGDTAARDRWEAATTWPLLIASVLFLIAYSWRILERNPSTTLVVVLTVILVLVWVAFVIDYVVRIILSPDKWWFIGHSKVDLLSVFIPIARPFRLLKYLGRIPLLGGNSGAALRRRVIIIAATFVVMFIYVMSLAEYAAERDAKGANITSFGDSIWWACVTMATVGYGDYYPITIMGRVLAVVLMIGGVAIVGTATGTLVSYLNDRMVTVRAREQRARQIGLAEEDDTGGSEPS
ncbi:two pore domain potassium channel family protein [Diaminobutyricibacter tongyongensis]|uniref:Two pore domain potassium channel family protein n=1 Tax=Leifsonia tongyongensis TaxID=1268043 RepID=A0A6L9Y0Y1_9MICO|nr:potassium channel family protein [Diaminobutyricibacter tongyongensis]NEN07321.1 two pore domain potassium channel family protein [Diaminobutyricibacter tongyongensis]